MKLCISSPSSVTLRRSSSGAQMATHILLHKSRPIKDRKSLFQSFNLSLTLSLFLCIRNHLCLTLRLQFLEVCHDSIELLVGHSKVFTTVLQCHLKRFDLGSCTLHLSFFGGLRHFVLIHELCVVRRSCLLSSFNLHIHLGEVLTRHLEDTENDACSIAFCTTKARLPLAGAHLDQRTLVVLLEEPNSSLNCLCSCFEISSGLGVCGLLFGPNFGSFSVACVNLCDLSLQLLDGFLQQCLGCGCFVNPGG